MSDCEKRWDLFISHASEDKAFVRPLAKSLSNLSLKVWYDEFELKLGDSLSRSIDKGLAGSHFGLVVISPHFIEKPWPERELRGLVAKQMIEGRSLILPVWHGVTKEQVLDFSPPLADTLAIDTGSEDAEGMALKILRVVKPDLYAEHPRSELSRMASGEALEELKEEIEITREELEETRRELAKFQCPVCGAEQIVAMPTGDQMEGFMVEYACGRLDGDYDSYLCPDDAKYPDIDQFKFLFESEEREVHEGSLADVPLALRLQKLKEMPKVVKTFWTVRVRSKTKNARATWVSGYAMGLSEEQALSEWLRNSWNPKVRKDLRRETLTLAEIDYEYVNP